ncbi:UDP-glucose/GDP-mannose dehydrogenase family protein [Patescibacteria group bacterium]|nr:UDP-glucose/GDP-mannose dehydrogenase family protein [Patescibacteria group bacterium]MBU1702956.1 UDP-glucose/GDP-mannose dehydrogenase family protein [Patescibacteria group bacterium]MBU1953964.1 UDP-glucose/GDP-mannose dehydrogenase family protein [Patescibacteria group bacterium]
MKGMKIAVFGCGYTGLTTAVGLAEMGNLVLGIDTDAAKLAALKRGRCPFFEPGLDKLIKRNLARKRLSFSSDAERSILDSDVIICAVATPRGRRNRADLRAVLKVAGDFGRFMAGGTDAYKKNQKLFINKSTVPVGTSEKIRQVIEKSFLSATKRKEFIPNFSVISNPEFLREGTALDDFMNPDRVVFGLEQASSHSSSKTKIEIMLSKIFRYDDSVPIIYTSLRNAEIIKYASNAFLATRISFANELADYCEKVGADITEVAYAMGFDPRIGHNYLQSGAGFGGSCLPKDLHALIAHGKKAGLNLRLLKAVKHINDRRPDRILEVLRNELLKIRGKKIAVWGLSFKPNTDDLRDAPSIPIIRALLKNGAKVHVFDPAAMNKFRELFQTKVNFGTSATSILKDADCLLILTDWREFGTPDFAKIKKALRNPLIVDGRNCLSPAEVQKHGFKYLGIGRRRA